MVPRLALAVLLLPLLAVASGAQSPGVKVTFEVNDAFVKSKPLAGVQISMERGAAGAAEFTGCTGADGRFVQIVNPGTWFVTYRLRGYVPVVRSETVLHGGAQVVTTSLSMNLEAEGSAGRRVRIILNWGSGPGQVRDVDAHALCPCSPVNAHVYYQSRLHEAGSHEVSLDVDDRDGGGPETITLLDPDPGEYRYFVHNFSGPQVRLGASELVVRVLSGNDLIGEFRVPTDVDQRVWRPFKHILVSPAGQVSIVPLDTGDLFRLEDRIVPAGTSKFREPADDSPPSVPPYRDRNDDAPGRIMPFLIVGCFIVAAAWSVLRRKKSA